MIEYTMKKEYVIKRITEDGLLKDADCYRYCAFETLAEAESTILNYIESSYKYPEFGSGELTIVPIYSVVMV